MVAKSWFKGMCALVPVALLLVGADVSCSPSSFLSFFMPMPNFLDPNNLDANHLCPFDSNDANDHWGWHHDGWGHDDDDGDADDADANTPEPNTPEPNTPEPNAPEPNNPPPPAQYQLTTSVVGGNGTLAPASGPQNANAVVTLTATPAAGYQVQAWVGTNNDASKANINTVTMTSAKSVTVQFQAIPPVGNAAAGQTLYTQSCQMCHGASSWLHNRGSKIITNLGSINPAMTFIALTNQQVLDLQAFAATQ
jgi:hypothetical protein